MDDIIVVNYSVNYEQQIGHFSWIVHSKKEVTLDRLIKDIRTAVSIPDEIEDNVIDVKYKYNPDVIQSIDDNELVSIIWRDSFPRVNLSLIINTPQKPFSRWKYNEVKEVFNISGENWYELPTYEGSTTDTSGHKKTIDTVVKNLLMIRQTSHYPFDANEASRRGYVSIILHGVASCFRPSFIVRAGNELAGNYGDGSVDWAIKNNNRYSLIVKVIKCDVNDGVAQMIIQLLSAYQRNRKNNYTGDLYGIVTTAFEWVILKLVMKEKENTNEPPIEVFRSSLKIVHLPLVEEDLDESTLTPRIENLFEQLLWTFNEQLKS